MCADDEGRTELHVADNEQEEDEGPDTAITADTLVAGPGEETDTQTGDVTVGGVTWSFGSDVGTDSWSHPIQQQKWMLTYFDFESQNPKTMARDLFWHLSPGKIDDFVQRGNTHIENDRSKCRKIGAADFETFWALVLAGTLCGASGINLWKATGLGFLSSVCFKKYMSHTRFKDLKHVSTAIFPL